MFGLKNFAKTSVMLVLCWGLTACVEKSVSAGTTSSLAGPQLLKIYKSPTCGCCGEWIDHMTASGFHSEVFHPQDLSAIKSLNGIPREYQSCHTAVSAQGYVFEGHLPAKYVEQFLRNPPAGAKGLVVPGMPVGSPGMEMGERFTPYQIYLLKTDGTTEPYAQILRSEDQQ